MTYARRYTQAQAETATPERLMVLLFEAALKHMRTGAASLDAGRLAEAAPSLQKAGDIVAELHSSLDRTRAPQLADQLAETYRFVCARILDASASRTAAPLREAERALAPVAEGFAQAVQAVGAGARP
jgi:flagellar protein FliS